MSYIVACKASNGGHMTVGEPMSQGAAKALRDKVHQQASFQVSNNGYGTNSQYVDKRTVQQNLGSAYKNHRAPHVSGGRKFKSTTINTSGAYVYHVTK